MYQRRLVSKTSEKAASEFGLPVINFYGVPWRKVGPFGWRLTTTPLEWWHSSFPHPPLGWPLAFSSLTYSGVAALPSILSVALELVFGLSFLELGGRVVGWAFHLGVCGGLPSWRKVWNGASFFGLGLAPPSRGWDWSFFLWVVIALSI